MWDWVNGRESACRKCSGEVTRVYSQMYKSRTKIRKQIRWKVSTSLELPQKRWWLRWLQLTLYEKEFWKSQPASHPFGWSLSHCRSISHQFWQLLCCKLRKDLRENLLPPELSCIIICNSRPQKGFVKLPGVINMQLLLKISIHQLPNR